MEIARDNTESAGGPDSRNPQRAQSRVWLFWLAPPAIFLIQSGGYLVELQAHPYSFFDVVARAYQFYTILFPIFLLVWAAAGFWLGRGQGQGSAPKFIGPAAVCIALALACAGTRIYATHIEPNRLVVREIEIVSEKIDRPLRLLHLSDIQSEAVGAFEEKIFERIRALDPDLLIHTGDLLHPIAPATVQSELPKLAVLFQSLDPRLGKFHVEGDTDWRVAGLGPDQLGGLQPLQLGEAEIDLGASRLRIVGLSLQQSRSGAPERIGEWLSRATPSDFNIVIGHNPNYILSIGDSEIDLCLAGHTHGGQIRIPGFGPLVTLSDVPPSWARGFRQVGRARLNVSAGLGCEHAAGLPDIRVFCPPEMTLIHLQPAKTNAE